MSRYDWQISCLTRTICSLLCGLVGTILVACQPTPEANVVGYLISQQMDAFANSGDQEPSALPHQEVSSGALIGRVMHDGHRAHGHVIALVVPGDRVDDRAAGVLSHRLRRSPGGRRRLVADRRLRVDVHRAGPTR